MSADTGILPDAAIYATWIHHHVPAAPRDIEGQCEYWAHYMAEVFPELSLCWGLVLRTDVPPYESVEDLSGHWWLMRSDGLLVDPTAHQFPWPVCYLVYDDTRGFFPLRHRERASDEHGLVASTTLWNGTPWTSVPPLTGHAERLAQQALRELR